MTEDRDDRLDALNRFARDDTSASRGDLTIPAQAFNAVGDRIVGAQNVAVRRNVTKVLADLKSLAAAAGGEWMYRIPYKDRRSNSTTWVEGPSVKLANDLARIYGNCSVSTVRVLDMGNEWLFVCRFVDYETGFDYERPFQQRKGASRIGGEDDGRRQEISFQIGASKAIRNVVVNALQTFADFAFEEARNAIVDRIGQDLPTWRAKTIARLADHVDLDRVERALGRKASEWLAPDVARAIAMMKAVTDGMATLDESFPPLGAAPDGGKAQADTFVANARERASQAPVDGSGVAPGPFYELHAENSVAQAAEQQLQRNIPDLKPGEVVDAQTGEIVEAFPDKPKKRVRRTKAQIAEDNAREKTARNAANPAQEGGQAKPATGEPAQATAPASTEPGPKAAPPTAEEPKLWTERDIIRAMSALSDAKGDEDLQRIWADQVEPVKDVLTDAQYARLERSFDRREQELKG